MEKLTIGKLANAVGMSTPTIRYYEEMGLLPAPRRSETGYRLYSQREIDRLRFIKRAKLLRLSLAEIKEVVNYSWEGRCGILQTNLLGLLKTKLTETDEKIAELMLFRAELQRFCDALSQRLPSIAQPKAARGNNVCACLEEMDKG